MFDAYIKGLKNWKRWDGRTRRRDYWLYSICNDLIILAAVSLAMLISLLEITTLSVFAWIAAVGYCILAIIPTIAITIRRLHDTGKGAPLIFLNIIPSFAESAVLLSGMSMSFGYILVNAVSISCSVYFFVMMVKKGDAGRNKFGPDPKDEFFDQENATNYGDYPNFRGE